MTLDFETCDVFTTTRFGGNPLAVVFDADGLDGAAMQTIAREFNLSETVFVLASWGAEDYPGRDLSAWVRRRMIHGFPSQSQSKRAINSTCGCQGWLV